MKNLPASVIPAQVAKLTDTCIWGLLVRAQLESPETVKCGSLQPPPRVLGTVAQQGSQGICVLESSLGASVTGCLRITALCNTYHLRSNNF